MPLEIIALVVIGVGVMWFISYLIVSMEPRKDTKVKVDYDAVLRLEHDTIFPLGEDPKHCRLCWHHAQWKVSCESGLHDHEYETVTMVNNRGMFYEDFVCSKCGDRVRK